MTKKDSKETLDVNYVNLTLTLRQLSTVAVALTSLAKIMDKLEDNGKGKLEKQLFIDARDTINRVVETYCAPSYKPDPDIK